MCRQKFFLRWFLGLGAAVLLLQCQSEKKNAAEPYNNLFGAEQFARIPAGHFQMGVNDVYDDDEKPVHTVTISRPFYLGKYEVTQRQWEAVMGNNSGCLKGEDRPIECVSWNEVQAFLQRLNQAYGRTLFRLPTEAEWEYACRAGSETPFYSGENLTTLQANYNGNEPFRHFPKGEYRRRTISVGRFLPNARGLFDMHGNVQEWCMDWYEGSYYANSPESDPSGPQNGSERVVRGGGWRSDARYCRSAARHHSYPDDREDDIGFRLVRRVN